MFLPRFKISLTPVLILANFLFIFYLLSSIFNIAPASAAISNASRIIPFQGTLTNSSGNYVADGNYSIVFAIYTVASGGTAAWSETQTVATTNGAFSVNIGSADANGVNIAMDTPPYYLGIKVGANAEMSPRIQLGMAPFAMTSKNMSGVYTDAAGNVGIGTTAPLGKLEVYGSEFYLGGTGTGTIYPSTSGQDLAIRSRASNIIFGSSTPAEFMRINSSGNVGIGTTAPLTILDTRVPYAKTDTTRRDFLFASNEAAPAGLRFSITGGASQAARSADLQTTDWGQTNGGNLNLQPYGGNVGIGTTSPAQKLSVAGTVESTTGGFKFPDGTTQTTAASGVTNGSISQIKLKTTTGSAGVGSCGTGNVTLPGGEYGFYPQVYHTGSGPSLTAYISNAAITGTAATIIHLAPWSASCTGVGYAVQRYVQASPPYFIEGYYIKHFLYALWNKTTNSITAMYEAEEPPWENNGRDPKKVPHPFANYFDNSLPKNLEIAMIDPTDVDKWKQAAVEKGLPIMEYLLSYMMVDPAAAALPLGPKTNKPITLPGNGQVVWRRIMPKTPEKIAAEQKALSSNIQNNTSSINTNRADLAEFYPAGPLLTPGDIVEPTLAHVNDAEANNPLKKNNLILIKTTRTNSPKVLGIISTDPAQVINVGGSDGELPLALSGRVPTKVSNLNGNINVGDPITSSSIPGTGALANTAGAIVGKALDEFYCESYTNCRDISKVKYWVNDNGKAVSDPQSTPNIHPVAMIVVFVNVSWYDPTVSFTSLGNLKIVGNESYYKLVDQDNSPISHIDAFAELVVGKIKAGMIETKKLVVSEVDILNQLNKLSDKVDKQQQTIDSQQKQVEGLRKEIEELKK